METGGESSPPVLFALLLPAALCAHLLAAQVWRDDIPPRFAPGQIVSVDFFDITAKYREGIKADSLPLPTTLGGLRVWLQQFPGGPEVPVPLISIEQERCGARAPAGCIAVTHVTLQIPSTLFIPPPGSLAPVSPASLVPVVDAVRRSPARFMPSADNIQIHLADSCDGIPREAGLSCKPSVAHDDGRIVSADAPAMRGETITIYALGLGRTAPDVVYEFAANAPPRPPSPKRPSSGSPPLVATLVPGYVGLYQLKVAIPAVPSLLPACGGSVVSNLTITILGRTSSAGAAICVEAAGAGGSKRTPR